MRGAFFSIGSQTFFLWKFIGALAIIIGFALLIGAIFNTVDSWRLMKGYPKCLEGSDMDFPDYAQLRLDYCQESFYNITGVQLQATQLTNTQKAQVLLNSIIKICFAVAVILFGTVLYRPFPKAKAAKGKKR